jgi:hypothetical protein
MRFMDKLDVVVVTRVHTADDDLAALREAERLSLTHAIEVWEGDRRVARVNKGNRPTADRQSL